MGNARPLLTALLGAVLLGSHPCAAGADEDDDRPGTPAKSHSDETAMGKPIPEQAAFSLNLSQDRQRLGGLKTEPLAPYSMAVETSAYGRVVDIKPLLDLRARYRAAQSDLAIAEAALRVAEKSHERLAKLHGEAIIPARDLILAESQLAAEQARREASARHVREIREETLQSFGEELFRQAVASDSPLLQGLLDRSLTLALIALPANQTLPRQLKSVAVTPSGERDKARKARLISPAPRTEESTQGETWFFAAESAGLRTGMRLDAWVPQTVRPTQGVLIPLSAVVWRDGQPWVFLKEGPEAFIRRPVGVHRERGEAWFVADGFAAGEQAVVVGGQMLLSEEQRRNAAQGADDD